MSSSWFYCTLGVHAGGNTNYSRKIQFIFNKTVILFHVVLLFDATLFTALSIVDIEIMHLVRYFVNLLIILPLFDIPHGYQYRTQSAETNRLSIDPQIKSAHFEYRDLLIGIMSIQYKSS